MGKIIVIGSQKGGVGKTTTTLNLAYSLKELGKKVLTVDFDSQANLTRDITIQSRNTGHYWYLHCTEYPMEQSLIIFHKHFFKCPYHQHGRANTLNQAVRSIKGHDKYQLEVRKCV